MAGNKIIAKIEEEAAKQNAIILQGAREKAQAVETKLLAAAQEEITSLQLQAKSEAEEVGRRQVLIAELECRKRNLSSKRAVMEKVFAQVEEALAKLPTDKWEALITSIVVAGSETGQEVLHAPAQDLPKYKNGFLAKLNAALVAKGKIGKLTLSDIPAKFTGGVELEGTTTDYDGSFASILRDVRQKQEREVAAILFGTEVK